MRQVMAAAGTIELEYRVLQLEKRIGELSSELAAMRQNLDSLLDMALTHPAPGVPNAAVPA